MAKEWTSRSKGSRSQPEEREGAELRAVTDTSDHKPSARFVLSTAYTLPRSPDSPETGPPVRHASQKEGLQCSPAREQ